MREVATTILDMIGLLLVAAGVAGGLAPFIGWWAACVAGAVVLAGSAFAHHRSAPVKVRR